MSQHVTAHNLSHTNNELLDCLLDFFRDPLCNVLYVDNFKITSLIYKMIDKTKCVLELNMRKGTRTHRIK